MKGVMTGGTEFGGKEVRIGGKGLEANSGGAKEVKKELDRDVGKEVMVSENIDVMTGDDTVGATICDALFKSTIVGIIGVADTTLA